MGPMRWKEELQEQVLVTIRTPRMDRWQWLEVLLGVARRDFVVGVHIEHRVDWVNLTEPMLPSQDLARGVEEPVVEEHQMDLHRDWPVAVAVEEEEVLRVERRTDFPTMVACRIPRTDRWREEPEALPVGQTVMVPRRKRKDRRLGEEVH